MIPTGASVFVATQPVDLHKGTWGLMALVQAAAPIRVRFMILRRRPSLGRHRQHDRPVTAIYAATNSCMRNHTQPWLENIAYPDLV